MKRGREQILTLKLSLQISKVTIVRRLAATVAMASAVLDFQVADALPPRNGQRYETNRLAGRFRSKGRHEGFARNCGIDDC